MQSLSQPMKAMRRYRLRYLLLLLLFYVWILIRLHTKTCEQSESTYHNLYRLYNDYNIIICLAFIGHGRDGNVSHHTSIWSKMSALPLLSVNNSICHLYIIRDERMICWILIITIYNNWITSVQTPGTVYCRLQWIRYLSRLVLVMI